MEGFSEAMMKERGRSWSAILFAQRPRREVQVRNVSLVPEGQ
jgi:hypothetical protein